MDSTSKSVSLKFNEAQQLNELFSIFDDLKYVYYIGKLFKEKYKAPEIKPANHPFDDHTLLTSSMWVSMIITYARCFATGIRFGLTPDIFNFHQDAIQIKKTHKYFIDMRSKHIAHSINSKESSETFAILLNGKVQTIACCSMRYIGSDSEVEVLCNLAGIAFTYIQNEVKKLEEIVLTKAKELSPQELEKVSKFRYVAESWEKANVPRKKKT